MKEITLGPYKIAIFKVDDKALHITVKSVKEFESVKLEEFRKQTSLQLNLYNDFSQTFSVLPSEWHERIIKNGQDNKKELLIIIIK